MKSSVTPCKKLFYMNFTLILIALVGFLTYSSKLPTAFAMILVLSGFYGSRQQFARTTRSIITAVSSIFLAFS